jgi:hypothetical protein
MDSLGLSCEIVSLYNALASKDIYTTDETPLVE